MATNKVAIPKEKITKKIDRITKDRENFCNVGWGYGDDDEYGEAYSQCQAEDTLWKFYHWIIRQIERHKEVL